MKIFFVIPRMNNGGAERVTAHLANALAKRDEVKILTFVSNESFYALENVSMESADCAINRANAVTRKLSIARNFLSAYSFLRKKIAAERPDTVISMLPEADLLTAAVKTLHREPSFKWISSERNDPRKRSGVMQKLLKKCYARTDAFVCQGKRVYDYYENVKNKTVIGNPLFVDGMPAPVPEAQPPRIVAVGRLLPQKNYRLLVDAFAAAAPALSSDVTLTVYGEGTQRDALEAHIRGLGLEDRIFLPGAEKNVPEKIKDAALFVMSSDYEGFPNALLEAMAMGLPVISTDFSTGIASELIGAENGCVVPVGDVSALADAIVSLMNDPVRRTQMRQNNLYVRETYDIRAVLAQWQQVIDGLDVKA